MNAPELPKHLRLKSLKNGAQSFEARIKREGIEISGTFKTCDEAEALGDTVDALIKGGMSAQDCKQFLKKKKTTSPQVKALDKTLPEESSAKTGKLTVAEAVQAFLDHNEKLHTSIPSNYLTDYEYVRDSWGNFPVSELRNEDLANFISVTLKTPIKSEASRLKKGTLKGTPRTYAEATVRKFIFAMKNALFWNIKNNEATINPFLFNFDSKVMPGAWNGKRERRLLKGEEERLYNAGLERGDYTYTKDDWRNIIGFALETAMRQQEIGKAMWKHVSQDGYKLHIPDKNTKGKIDRTILLSKRAREIIALQQASCPENSVRIFHQFPSIKAICDSFATLTARAGIEDFHFHDLRHEATSRLCISGKLPLMALMEMTGHKSMTTFRGYVHLITHGNELRLD
jgi:integrase